jgi:hypothetical protein
MVHEEMNLWTQYSEKRAHIADALRAEGKKPREISAALSSVIPIALRASGVPDIELHQNDDGPVRWDATDAFGVGPGDDEHAAAVERLEGHRTLFQKD